VKFRACASVTSDDNDQRPAEGQSSSGALVSGPWSDMTSHDLHFVVVPVEATFAAAFELTRKGHRPMMHDQHIQPKAPEHKRARSM
jgi:hypothetical protein